MPTFPDFDPAPGMTKQSQPQVRIARFGSGYSQRSIFGLNQNPKSYNLTFRVSESESDTIEDFLDARGGVENFDYTARRVSCQEVYLSKLDKDYPFS